MDVNSDKEYSCLLNCREGYYIYDIGREDDCDDDDDGENIEGDETLDDTGNRDL